MGADAQTATTVAVPATAKRGAAGRAVAVLFSRRRHADVNGRRCSNGNDRRRAGDG